MSYFCCDERRRAAVRADVNKTGCNGIDFLEVVDHDAPVPKLRQRQVRVHFVNDLAPAALTADNVRIEGGERITGIKVLSATLGTGSDAKILTVEVDRPGDFSPYTLRLVEDAKNLQSTQPPDRIDPALAAVVFSFKVECPSDFDCQPENVCPTAPQPRPDIDYLAKDYASFRRLLLDRLALLMPSWTERNSADIGVTLVELLAYVGDYLSYQQDAAATEAYLGTARRRISVRRHAFLVDYAIDDGASARTWVCIHVPADVERTLKTNPAPVTRGAKFLTRIPGQLPVIAQVPDVLLPGQVVFESMQDVNVLYAAHNEMKFYTWSDERCCLPKGATRAYLLDDKDNRLRLCSGDVLIFEEKRVPDTGKEADADPTRRWAIRLTSVNPEAKKVLQKDNDVDIEVRRTAGTPRTDQVTGKAYVEIAWAAEDALPFAFCASAKTDVEHGGATVTDVSVARGNIVPADHGLTIATETLPPVPPARRFQPVANHADRCHDRIEISVPARFRPMLERKPLTQSAPFDPVAPAGAARIWINKYVLPAIHLTGVLDGKTTEWLPRRDLLNSRPGDPHFVVEIEGDGTAQLRYGDGKLGQRPEPGTIFTARYRVGNGAAGQLGADSLFHLTAILPGSTIRNPLPAWGGQDPESLEDVRQRAPSAFRTQERAVTAADYAEVTERDPLIQRAAATFRWTGSWHTVFLTADRVDGLAVDVDDVFKKKTKDRVERYRMAGQDLDVDAPRFVAMEIELHVCALPDYFRSHVKEALLEVFSRGVLTDGTLGQFHPDRFTFGHKVYLSRLFAAAQAVQGVASVNVTVFQRLKKPETSGLDEGELRFDRLEIPRLDNDRNFPERGIFRLDVGGGK
jgi:hypothetical protein